MELPWSREEFEEAFFDPSPGEPETEQYSSESETERYSEDEPLILDEPFALDWPDEPEPMVIEPRLPPLPRVPLPPNAPYGYLSHLPPELVREELLRLDPLTTQRLCRRPEFAPRCDGKFWGEKLGYGGETTSDIYGTYVMNSGNCTYGTISLTNSSRNCILDALATKDLDRFRYYLEHTNFRRDTDYGKAIEWFAYFAGPEFYQAWGHEDNVIKAKIYALTGDADKFIDLLWNDKRVARQASVFLAAAASGGSVPILRYLLESEQVGDLVRGRYQVGGRWSPRFIQIIAQARHYKQARALKYLLALAPEFARTKRKAVEYYTQPQKQKGKYRWTTQE